jgi:hypothetical protein
VDCDQADLLQLRQVLDRHGTMLEKVLYYQTPTPVYLS